MFIRFSYTSRDITRYYYNLAIYNNNIHCKIDCLKRISPETRPETQHSRFFCSFVELFYSQF